MVQWSTTIFKKPVKLCKLLAFERQSCSHVTRNAEVWCRGLGVSNDFMEMFIYIKIVTYLCKTFPSVDVGVQCVGVCYPRFLSTVLNTVILWLTYICLVVVSISVGGGVQFVEFRDSKDQRTYVCYAHILRISIILQNSMPLSVKILILQKPYFTKQCNCTRPRQQ